MTGTITSTPVDLYTSAREGARSFKVSSKTAFSAAGESGRAYARVVPVTLPVGAKYSIKIEKNSNIAVSYVRAKGLYIEAVKGSISGSIIALEPLISTNGLFSTGFTGLIEVYNDEPVGAVVLGANDELNETFYPDGEFVVELRNETQSTVSTFLSIGVEQVSDPGVYQILEPDTLLTETTEMGEFNGSN